MKKEWEVVLVTLKKDYDSKKPKKYITSFDMNNLYGYAISQYLLYANFKWVKNINETKQKLIKIKNK